MEKRKCKLCPRTFIGGRALGGHMKSHLQTPALQVVDQDQQLVDNELTESSSANSSFLSSSSFDEEQLKTSSLLGYGLRENPRRSVKLQDPEFSSSLDREGETESTRKRSRRARKVATPPESEQLSSVSDTSPEEDLAVCLMLLSRDHSNWRSANTITQKVKVNERKQKKKKKKKTGGGKFKCEKCMERYRSAGALTTHKRVCSLEVNEEELRVFECPYCLKLFGSGQALGGHKKAHLAAINNNSNCDKAGNFEVEVEVKFEAKEEMERKEVRKCGFLDLNLPASPGDEEEEEEDQFSAVLEA